MQGQSVEPDVEMNLPPGLHPLVALILDRPDVQDRLGGEIDANAFVASALAIADENRVLVDEAALRAALRPDPIGVGRFGAAPLTMSGWPPRGWLPTRPVPTAGAPAFDWLWVGSRKLVHPFFEDDIRRAGSLPLNWLLRIRTSLAELVAGAESQASLPLGGMVFHMSRCGSTLAAQMLGAVPGHAVSSEPEPLDAVLRWCAESGASLEQAIAAVRAMVAALGRDRGHGGTLHFIKMQTWHTLFLPLLRQALPHVNWIYLHREPVEVLVSLRDMPSPHMVPGMIAPGYFGLAELPDLPYSEFSAFATAQFAAAVPEQWHLGGGMVLEYPQIRAAMPTNVAAHLGLSLDEADRTLMHEAGKRDAKAPEAMFTEDSARKRAAAGPELTAIAEHWLGPVRERLVALQVRGGSAEE